MKFHLRTQLNQCHRETPIQQRVEVETRVEIPLLRRRKSNRLFRNKRNDKLPHLAVSVRENPRKNILDRNGQIRIRLRFLRGPHV